MNKLLHHLAPSVGDCLTDKDSALLIVDDRLSLANALAASRGGQRFAPYVASFGKYPDLVRTAADRLRWDLNVISLPTHKPGDDFMRLALHHHCMTRLEFEYGFLLLHICAGVREQRIVWPAAKSGRRVRATLQRIAGQHDKALLMPVSPNEIVTRAQIEAMIELAQPMLHGPQIQ
jgi:hypothetical protein